MPICKMFRRVGQQPVFFCSLSSSSTNITTSDREHSSHLHRSFNVFVDTDMFFCNLCTVLLLILYFTRKVYVVKPFCFIVFHKGVKTITFKPHPEFSCMFILCLL